MHQVSLSWIFLYMCQNPFLYIDVTVSDNLSFILKYLKHEIEKRKVEDIFELTYYVGTENIKKGGGRTIKEYFSLNVSIL